MFNYKIDQLNSKTLKIQLCQQEKVLSIAQVWELWEHNQEFCQFYNTLLSKIPFRAFFWEHPPFVLGNLEHEQAYVHLANFIRMAEEEQRRALWQSLALALKTWVPQRKTWLSTSGLGISWLHVRLDQRPKYYYHKAYKTL